MAEYVNGSTDILGGSVIRYALNTTTPNQAVIRKIIAGNGISITSTGVDDGTGDVTISIDTSGTGGSGGGDNNGGGTGGGGTPTAVGTVTSVNMVVPTGFTILGGPITTAGTFILQLASGYTIPLYTDIEKGVIAYDNTVTNISYDTSTGIISIIQRDGDSMIATVTLDPFTTSNLAEGSNLYYTDARARAAISLTTTGNNGSSTYSALTGVLNVPTYTLDGLGGVPLTRTITIDGVTHNLSADRTWDILPSGGLTGQILAKTNASNYNVEWIDNYTSIIKHPVKAAEPLVKGQAVYISGSDGTNKLVSKASNLTEATSSKTFGLIDRDLATNEKGFVIAEGILTGLNTASANSGDPVWLGTAGNLLYGLVNKPYAPDHMVFIGIVLNSNANNGEIFVKVQNGFELDELHNVAARNPNNGDIIQFVSSTGLWTKTAGTTTNISEGTNLYYTDARVRAAISETITGIDYNSSTGVFSLSSGYVIPTTTEETNWNTAYSWGNHSIVGYELQSNKGIANGYASLDSGGRVPAAQLPSYVDDVLEYANLASFPATGETGKIYVALDNNKIYRWSGSTYIEISPGNQGTVSQVSVVSANGFAGTVANDTTTPAITLSTTITGILKGNGTAVSAAIAGTDYQAPITLTTTGNSGAATLIGNTLNVPVYTFITNGLASGGIVTWSGTGFIYDVSAAYYYLNGVYYSTSNTQVTLGAADISNPRLDIVAVNDQGQVIVIPGVPSSNPVKAQIDPTTQIELATILVPAGATSPVNILTAIVYDETSNSTWSSLASGVTVDFANTTTPYTGTVTASVTASTTGTRYIQFSRITGTDSVSNYSVLKFAIRLGTAWTSTSTLAIGFYNGTTLISTEVSVLNGQFGFNMATTATYQLIQIPIANWRFTQSTFNRIRFRFLNSLPAFRMDRVELQAGVVQTLVQSNNIYTTDGSLAGIRTLTLNGNYLDIVGSGATTRFNVDGSVSIGGTITATTLASGSDKLVLASATGVLSAVTIGTGLSYSGGILTATGTLTSASFATDYDNTVTGLRNSSNTVYTTSQNFVSGSTRVFVNGVRQSRGASYDYTETGANQITFNYAPDAGDLIVIDYIKS